MFTYCSVAALVLELAGRIQTDAMAHTHMVFATCPFSGKIDCLSAWLSLSLSVDLCTTRLQHGHMGEALPIKNGKSDSLAVL